jgi:Replication-relaxation
VALPNTYGQFPVAPDGFFTSQDAQGRTHYFVEADRGTMTLKRFTQKLLAYAAHWRAKRHTEKFKIKHFRVLTVASSAVRCENLMRATAAAPDVRDRPRPKHF